jgi:holo-[acyl-carrier protein] synthase
VISGTGIDLVEIPRIARILERNGGSFLRKNFHPGEIAASKGLEAEYYAILFALKEAVLKSLGQGLFTLDLAEMQVSIEAGRAKIELPGFLGEGRVIDAAYSSDHAWAVAIAVQSSNLPHSPIS